MVGKQVSFGQAESLLKKYNIPVCVSKVCQSKEELIAYAERAGFPVVLKIVSSTILHKTDVGGVKINLKSVEEVSKAYNEILEKVPKEKISGFLMQKMVNGVEVIIGSKVDEQFGPVILFGLGGIFVEVLKDVAFRIAPISQGEASEMIKEVKSYPILKGVRGVEGVNIKALETLLVKTSKMVMKEKSIVEMDLNPVMVDKENAIVVDARIIIK